MLVRVPATSANLGPGFDTLGLALNMHNYFEVTKDTSYSLTLTGEGANIPKLLRNNNFVKIFKDVYIKLGGDPNENFRFNLKNNIPISRGLGSSSAIIIGAISCAYKMLNKPFKKDSILKTALEYESHPDNITPACNGGFNVTVVKNKKVFYIKTYIPDDIKAVIVIPNRSISTSYARKILPKQYTSCDAIFNLSLSSMLTGIFISKSWNLLKIANEDRFHQDKRMALYPILFTVRKEACKHGALMSVLSGSGSTFLNICYRDDAKKLNNILSNKFPDFRVLSLDFDNTGILFK